MDRIILLLLIVVIFILFIFELNYYNNYIDNIQAYVITLKSPERIKNIEENKIKTKLDIELVDGVHGDTLNFEDLINQGKLLKDFYEDPNSVQRIRKREVGCYLSHLKTYEIIKNNKLPGYSIVFEDDFKVVDSNFVKKINKALHILKKHDDNFDFLFLGNTFGNKDKKIYGNLYTSNKSDVLYGCHAMLINNKKIDSIYEKLKYIDGQIDVNITKLNSEGKLIIYTLNPTIVNQAGLESSIMIF
jgi:GR25 family glycosyltransferase involved in LPS biosynthesis